MKDWTEEKRKLASEVRRILLEHSLKVDNYTLHLGRKTKYYIDLRLIPSFPSSFRKICDAYYMMIKNEIDRVDKIVGVPTAAIPFASVVSLKLNVPCVYIEKIETDESLADPMKGVLKEGEHVVLLDDVSASGITLLCMATVIRALGGKVTDAVVLVDRQEGAVENLKKADINLHYLLTLEELIGGEKASGEA